MITFGMCLQSIQRIPLLRISIYDPIAIERERFTVNDILRKGNNRYFDGMVKFIEQKMSKVIDHQN